MNWYKRAKIKGVIDAKGWEEFASKYKRKVMRTEGREPDSGEIQEAYFDYLFRVPKRRTVPEEPALV